MPADNDSLIDVDELAGLLEAHEGPPQARPNRAGSAGRTRRAPRLLELRWAGVVAVAALLVGSGLGFGLATSATPSGTAGTNVVGFGFLPARGWTVLQSATVDPSGGANAIAANAPLHSEDDLGGLPHATLESMPSHGILIFATFTTRGDPREHFKFEAQALPLRVSAATPVAPERNPLLRARGVSEYRLLAGVGAYNVDTRFYFGTSPPSATMLAAAHRQLSRLVVASDRVTIRGLPTILAWGQRVTLGGSIASGRAGELIDIQAKDCGQRFFRGVAGTTTTTGGGWTVEYAPGINTTLRAVWKGNASAQIAIKQRVWVGLRHRPDGPLRVAAAGVGGAATPFWRKRVLIQQRRGGGWRTIKEVVLTDSTLRGTEFTVPVPRGTLIRAVLPLSQARPCYLAGISNPLRT